MALNLSSFLWICASFTEKLEYLNLFVLILVNTFYFHINNIILFLGKAVLKSKMKNYIN